MLTGIQVEKSSFVEWVLADGEWARMTPNQIEVWRHSYKQKEQKNSNRIKRLETFGEAWSLRFKDFFSSNENWNLIHFLIWNWDNAFISLFNTQTVFMYILSRMYRTALLWLHKNLIHTLTGFEPCSWGGCDVDCATPPWRILIHLLSGWPDWAISPIVRLLTFRKLQK
jgi:hypothetical protein